MSNDDAETKSTADYREPKRWFRQHPELGTPGRLPVSPYESQEQHEVEKKYLWRRVWLMMGRVEEVEKPGQFFVTKVPPCDAEVLVVRGRDGEIRAFHNVCTHRGCPITWEEKGKVGAFKCPFHGFVFDLSGGLAAVPDEENFYDLDKSKYSLSEINMEIWNGFIFVHFDPEPRQGLREFLAETADRLDTFPFQDATHYYEYQGQIDCNWKLVLYGFLENYHTQSLHKTSISPLVVSHDNPFSHNLKISLSEKHRFMSLFGNPNYKPTDVGSIASKYGVSLMQVAIDADDLEDCVNPTKSDCWSFDINNIFPNFQLNVVNGTWYCHRFWPLSPDKMQMVTRVYFPKPKNAGERFFQEYSKVTTRDVLLEDATLGERLQSVLRSKAVEHWLLQDEEIAIQHFHHTLDKFIEHERRDRP
ncbi:MAG: hypothetical protein CMI63_21560 [Parvularcula sp.]|nr:hypothetical protein [Parvularcula sp.]